MVTDTAKGRADRITQHLVGEDLDVEYSVESHTSRDIAFDIVQTARNDGADLILMGYPEASPELTQVIEYKSPCDVVFAAGFRAIEDVSIGTVTVGAGGGPHHLRSLEMVRALATHGASVRIVSVAPTNGETYEDPGDTVAAFEDLGIDVREVEAGTVADGLVEGATAEGGVLVIGASRDRRLSQWVFGSTPDRVVARAEESDVPVLVYATAGGVPGRIEDYLFPVYRYLRKRLDTDDTTSSQEV